MDHAPPVAPKKGASILLAEADDAWLKAQLDKEHEDKMAVIEELLTPLPADASLLDIERRRLLLADQENKVAERDLDLTNKESEFLN